MCEEGFAHHQAYRILVVDDEKDLVMALKTRLEFLGYTVLTASDGRQAYGAAVRRQPDAILMDLMMPGMDGYSTLQKLKSNPKTRAIPVIVLTGKEKMREACELEGVEAYLVKPFDFQELLKQIESALKRTPAPDKQQRAQKGLRLSSLTRLPQTCSRSRIVPDSRTGDPSP